MAISMLKIRRSLGRLIFNMGIAIPGKTVFLIETAPRMLTFSYYWLLSTKAIYTKQLMLGTHRISTDLSEVLTWSHQCSTHHTPNTPSQLSPQIEGSFNMILEQKINMFCHGFPYGSLLWILLQWYNVMPSCLYNVNSYSGKTASSCRLY